MDDEQNILCIPLASLARSGALPAAGDEVEATVKGTVAHLDGQHAYLHVDDVNGEAVLSPSTDSEPDEDDMRRLAAAADDQGSSDDGEEDY